MKFFKTIQFRLTLWYSLLLIFISFIVIFTINLVITTYYKKEFEKRPIPPHLATGWKKLDKENKEFFYEYRQQDLAKIRQISLLSFIPLTFFSFLGGYFIAGEMLRPLRKLNTSMRKVNAKNLTKQIHHTDTGDEVSELINNFNRMINRLNTTFKLQKQFIANASHELKTPLAVIQTNLESIISDTSVTKKEMREHIATSLKSVDLMNSLIEDLLLLSLLENHIQKESVNITEIIEASVDQLAVLAKKKNIQVVVNNKSGKHSCITSGNRVLLQRAFMNIIENAIKYSKKNRNVSITMRKKKSNVYISICDHGIGIPVSEQKRIFERFYRVDTSRSKESGGFGLGLAITKKIVELHHGRITVTSRSHKGTTFTITLPSNKPSSSTLQAKR